MYCASSRTVTYFTPKLKWFGIASTNPYPLSRGNNGTKKIPHCKCHICTHPREYSNNEPIVWEKLRTEQRWRNDWNFSTIIFLQKWDLSGMSTLKLPSSCTFKIVIMLSFSFNPFFSFLVNCYVFKIFFENKDDVA